MTILKIIKYPDPILSRKTLPIEKITPEIAKLMGDMVETMYAEAGVGLAAPQIGISKRVMVIDVGVELDEGFKKPYLIQMANPEIVSAQGEVEWEEGCLSIPDFRLNTKRKAKVVVKGMDKNNKTIEILAEGLLAIAFQHEIDHLDGKLLIDMVSKTEREKYLKLCK
ncbi:MAG: peptide deformylase [Deltaproteobacteria bacterium RIFCSPLOWO2_02_FULL_47_10]|nr:MAG: peptide deformylase [Deltaproteobacteria bacterium RIFCSPLOWO2_02_FULL_47_10]